MHNIIKQNDKFKHALAIINQGRISGSSIGLLQEKTLHATIKHMISTDINHHEIRIHQHIADVFVDDIIYEIQTRNFDKMRSKIKSFTPLFPLHIIYPIAKTKVIRWYSIQNEFIKQNKSPKKGRIYDVLLELYKIKPLLNNPNLFIDLYFFDVEELRILDGWDQSKKKGASKVDQLPLNFVNIINLHHPDDYLKFLPDELNYPFTNKDLSKLAKITLRQAGIITLILKDLHLIQKVGTRQRSYLYDLV